MEDSAGVIGRLRRRQSWIVGIGGTLVVVLALILLRTASAAPKSRTDVPTIWETGSRPIEFGSISDLASDAALVVLVDGPGSIARRTVVGGEVEVVTLEPKRVIAGDSSAMSQQIVVHSFARNSKTDDLVLAEDGKYLVFLTPFYTTVGEVTGEWTVTGGPAGIYVGLADGMFHKLDPESPALPESLDLAALKLPDLKPADYFIRTGADLTSS